MARKTSKPHLAMQAWIDARRRHRLSHAQVQMARELGMNPKKFGKLDNHNQEPWKTALPEFIEDLYFKRFHKKRPDSVLPIDEQFRQKMAKKEARRTARRERKAAAATGGASSEEITPAQRELLPS